MLIEILEKDIDIIKKYVRLGLIPNQYLRYIEIYRFYQKQEEKKVKDKILNTSIEFNLSFSMVKHIIKKLNG